MVKLIALYRQPNDKEAFDEHYTSVHTPLVEQVPGLQKLEVTRIVGTPMGKPAGYYLMAEMYFADQASFEAAMASKENRAAGKDVMSFAGDIVEMMVGESEV
ncbi:EthD family reductase [Alicyclobacillus ferrooxydans]|uniref:Ethyl tert-butyl ether degradation protein EthD n=1 Tax=Alicyclobacillus ferrooxydans TaxID=471514 RepID=A0A0P9EMH0_9BACL|nr:EthD family reductase [Alicyclobacillus ferrooxydans]KPV44558.1 ethyl tert-butyl ether degradation protein EthD [Alicyclobacillus ferrooxydans]